MIESDDPLVQRSGTWTYQDTPNASGGNYLYSSGSLDDALELHFTGTTIEIVYVTHPALGIFAIEIDNVVVRTVNAYSEETAFGVVSAVSYLADEPHLLRVYPASGVIAIDAFLASIIPSMLVTPTPAPWIGDTSIPLMPESYTPLAQEGSNCEVNTVAPTTDDFLDAVHIANHATDGRIYCIYLLEGDYVLEETLLIASNVRIYGRGYPTTTVQMNLDISEPVIATSGLYYVVELHHLQIEKGRAGAVQGGYGGGIYNNRATLRIYDSYLSDNSAWLGGGAIINYYGTLTIQRSTFADNSAGGGGAIQNRFGTAEISTTCFVNNSAGYAGAFLNSETGSIANINQSNFQNNLSTVYGGGAIYNLATPELDASMNSWSTGSPVVNNATPSVDSVSERVNFNPVLAGSANCSPQPPVPLPSTAQCVVYVNYSIHLYRSPVHARTEVTRDNVLRTPIHTAYIEQTLQSGNQLIVDIRYLEDENLGEHPIVRVIKYNPSTSSTSYDENDTGWVSLAEGAYLWINSSPVSATEGVVTPVDNLEDADACVLSDLRDRTQIGLSPSDLALEELCDYGVEVAYGSSSLAGVSAPSRVWSSSEIFALRDGVSRSAAALQAVSASTSSLEAIFRTVMVGDNYIMFVRLPHPSTTNLYFAATPPGSCQYWDPRTVNDVHYPVIVACNGNMKQEPQWLTGGEVLEEAVVHELGHVFDNRVMLSLSGALQRGLPNGNFNEVMYDCGIGDGRKTVMGVFGGEWVRGHAGWGSPMPVYKYESAGNFQRFIQNYDNDPKETAADMFLNWVFRRTTSGDPIGQLDGEPCTNLSSGNWDGFQNILANGLPDSQLPGNVRYWWMDTKINVLLTANGWNGGN